MKRITIISTGGTIEKTYCPDDGSLRNAGSVLDRLLDTLVLSDLEIVREHLFDKDSLDMDEHDHELVAAKVVESSAVSDGVIVVHGTDRLAVTGELVLERLRERGGATCPVVLTGAMRPFELRTSDATQNVTESLLAVRILGPGVFCVMHGRVLEFPGVVKDVRQGTFVRSPG